MLDFINAKKLEAIFYKSNVRKDGHEEIAQFHASFLVMPIK